jgi:hypothetical protein
MVLVLCVLAPVTPQLRALLPVEQSLLLLVTLLAACSIVAWRQGASPWFALVFVVLGIAMLLWRRQPEAGAFGFFERGWAFDTGSPYTALARGWTLLLAASFGFVSLFSPAQSFLSRALSTLALAAGLGFILILMSPAGPARISGTMATEYTRRVDESTEQMREAAALAKPKDATAADQADRINQAIEEQTAFIAQWSVVLFPALLALESLAAMAIAWSLYNRLSSVPVGPALSRLRDFRFNDQLVWGVAVGASIFILPPFAEGKNAGLNLLVFFGALYVLRGLGILGWISNGHIVRLALAIALFSFIAVFVAYQLGFLVALGAPLVLLAFSLGIGDTWVDWRRLLQPKPI